MKLKELEATKIVKFAMGEREGLKSEEVLSAVLKKRLTKKERTAMNSMVGDKSENENILARLNVDQERFDEIIATAIKKIKNESLHRELYE